MEKKERLKLALLVDEGPQYCPWKPTSYVSPDIAKAIACFYSEYEGKLGLDHCRTAYYKCSHLINKPRL